MDSAARLEQRDSTRRRRALGRYWAGRIGRGGYDIDPKAIALREGLTGGVAVTLLVILAMVLRRADISWAPYAAFWTCLADPRTSAAKRLGTMALFVVIGALVAGIVPMLAGPDGMATGLILAPVVGCCMFAGLRVPGMENVGVLVAVVCVVAVEQPVAIAQAPLRMLIFAGGGALAMLLCFAAVASSRPARITGRAARLAVGDPQALRHAALTAGGVLSTYTVAHALSLPFPQWATIAAVVVTRPDLHASRRRTIERVAGSLVGALTATTITLAVTGPWALIPPIFLLAVGAITMRSVNYTLFVSCLTPLFVLVGTITSGATPFGAAASRLADNVLGSILTFLVCAVLWGAGRLITVAAQR